MGKKRKRKENKNHWTLETLNIKEVCDKYKDKVVKVDMVGRYPVIVMDNCRIKYTGLMNDYYNEDTV